MAILFIKMVKRLKITAELNKAHLNLTKVVYYCPSSNSLNN
jgi:hypothetical protein